jgi:ribosomal protein L40E
LNKANVLAVGVLLIALSLYLQVLYNIPQGSFKETIENYNINEGTFVTLTTLVFSAGLIVVIGSILIKPARRRIVIPGEAASSETVEEGYRKEAAYSGEEEGAVEKGEVGLEQAYEEEAPAEESYEATEEEAAEKEEKPEKVGEIVGFCPRCGAPVSEGMRYCRKCGLKLK